MPLLGYSDDEDTEGTEAPVPEVPVKKRQVKSKDYRISTQAKKGVWHLSLKESKTENAAALRSDIFDGVAESNKMDHHGHAHDVGLLTAKAGAYLAAEEAKES